MILSLWPSPTFLATSLKSESKRVEILELVQKFQRGIKRLRSVIWLAFIHDPSEICMTNLNLTSIVIRRDAFGKVAVNVVTSLLLWNVLIFSRYPACRRIYNRLIYVLFQYFGVRTTQWIIRFLLNWLDCPIGMLPKS